MMRAYCKAADQPWAITEAALDKILEIASRENLDPAAIAAQLGRPLKNTQTVEERNGVAIIPVMGPIFQRANLFTEISGATSTQVLATDFTTALNNPAIRAIVLDIDSPGGEVAGINEMSQMVYDARNVKPIVAYVGAQAASGAYWIASAAEQVVADDTAIIGSIGTVVSVKDTSERDAKSGVKRHEIVSSQSPLKRAGPQTDAGRTHLQEIVDSLADVFIGSVARNRNVSTDEVISNFGRGGQLVGAQAVAAGMADRLGSFEGVIAELSNGSGGYLPSPLPKLGGSAARETNKGERMTKPEAADPKPAEHPAADPKPVDLPTQAQSTANVVELNAAAIAQERSRIAAILGCDEAKGREGLARAIALETTNDVAAAKKLLAAAPVQAAPAASPLAAAMNGVPNPKVGTGASEPLNDDQAEVAAIVGVMKSLKGVR